MAPNGLDTNKFVGKTVPSLPNNYVIRNAIGDGRFGTVFLAESDELKHKVACKIIERRRLVPNWQAEIHRANTLSSPGVVRFTHMGDWIDAGAGIDCVVFCAEYVRGMSLRSFLKGSKDQVTVNFVVSMLKELLDFLHAAQAQNISHGDLHAGNILVEDHSGSLLRPLAFRITDFGVTSAESDSVFRDDLEQLAVVLRQCLKVIKYEELGARDRFFFNVLKDEIVRHLVEKDPTRSSYARRPDEIYRRLNLLDREFETAQARSIEARLSTPFDYLSCDQIGEAHSLLKALYSDLFLGLPIVESRNNLVLTGPRGCGKSTVFKSISLSHRYNVGDDVPSNTPYIGVYYRCDDLYFSFPRYRIPDREEWIDLPIHFLTATLLSDLLRSLEQWARRHAAEDLERVEASIAADLFSLLGTQVPQGPDGSRLRGVCAYLDKERSYASEKARFANDETHKLKHRLYGPEVLAAVCARVSELMPLVRDRPIFFLIDDYSAPKITFELQKSLNRLTMQRTSACFFKLSTESPVSYTAEDLDKKHYVESREFVLANLGLEFLAADAEKKLPFLDDVFRKRLTAIEGYPVGDLQTLVGESEAISHNALARAIRANEKPMFSGRQSIASLCSGDIHYVIQVVGKMVASIGGPSALAASTEVPRIKREAQNKAIRDEAGVFLRNLRSIMTHGERLVAVVTAFGNVAGSYLRFKNSKNEVGRPPHQASRIEPYDQLKLSPEAAEIYRELLRYSVFLEDVRGKSRRNKVVPRLYLRRFLIPHFNLTFSMRDSLELEPRAVEQLLLDPSRFERKHRLESDVADDYGEEPPVEPDRQTSLRFPGGTEPENP